MVPSCYHSILGYPHRFFSKWPVSFHGSFHRREAFFKRYKNKGWEKLPGCQRKYEIQYVNLTTINYFKITSFHCHSSFYFNCSKSLGYSKQSVRPAYPELNSILIKETYNITCICMTQIRSNTSSTCKDSCWIKHKNFFFSFSFFLQHFPLQVLITYLLSLLVDFRLQR